MTLLQDIADVADELCDARQHVERIPFWDVHRNRKHRLHVTIQRGLLAQLYESVIPSGAAAESLARAHPASRPPLALEALSQHTVITIAAARWCWSLKLDQRDTVEGNIRALVGAVPTLDHDSALALLTELRRWRRIAAVMTGWESPLFAPRVPCPVCERPNGLRINLQVKQAFCTGCDATWDEDSIGILADYIRTTTEAA